MTLRYTPKSNVYTYTIKHKQVCVFMAAIFVTPLKLETTQIPMYSKTDKLLYIHIMEYFTATEMNYCYMQHRHISQF